MYEVTGGVTGYIVYDPLGRIFEYTGNGGITHQFLWDPGSASGQAAMAALAAPG